MLIDNTKDVYTYGYDRYIYDVHVRMYENNILTVSRMEVNIYFYLIDDVC